MTSRRVNRNRTSLSTIRWSQKGCWRKPFAIERYLSRSNEDDDSILGWPTWVEFGCGMRLTDPLNKTILIHRCELWFASSCIKRSSCRNFGELWANVKTFHRQRKTTQNDHIHDRPLVFNINKTFISFVVSPSIFRYFFSEASLCRLRWQWTKPRVSM